MRKDDEINEYIAVYDDALAIAAKDQEVSLYNWKRTVFKNWKLLGNQAFILDVVFVEIPIKPYAMDQESILIKW